MKILADLAIPHVADAFADLGDVRLMPGREITRSALADCRCLVARTVTRIDARLLEDSPVEFVGTATIGTDHMDLDYLASRGIAWASAPGCNAEGAAEYVISGLFALAGRRGFNPFELTAGIVGYGNVGSRLHHKLTSLGINCLVCDPPKQAAGDESRAYASLDDLLERCDLLSLHVPLTDAGAYPTRHLFDAERLARLRPGCILVNAARGEVVDNNALLHLLEQRDDLVVFLDTWEGEPLVNRDLLARVDLATPHIAGYSVEGRMRGTQMVREAAGVHFGRAGAWELSGRLPPPRQLDPGAVAGRDYWEALFRAHWDISRDHQAFVAGVDLDADAFSEHFDGLRRVYPDRLEYPRFCLPSPPPTIDKAVLLRLGFQVAD